MGEEILPILRASAIHIRVFPNVYILNALLAVVQNGKFPFESDFLSVVACSPRQISVGRELRGVPFSASPDSSHSAACPGQFTWSNHGKPLSLDKTSMVLWTEESLNILKFKNALKINTGKYSFGAHIFFSKNPFFFYYRMNRF